MKLIRSESRERKKEEDEEDGEEAAPKDPCTASDFSLVLSKKQEARSNTKSEIKKGTNLLLSLKPCVCYVSREKNWRKSNYLRARDKIASLNHFVSVLICHFFSS